MKLIDLINQFIEDNDINLNELSENCKIKKYNLERILEKKFIPKAETLLRIIDGAGGEIIIRKKMLQ